MRANHFNVVVARRFILQVFGPRNIGVQQNDALVVAARVLSCGVDNIFWISAMGITYSYTDPGAARTVKGAQVVEESFIGVSLADSQQGFSYFTLLLLHGDPL
ncbi:hypothetical protein D8B25_08970 [Verminephrobacter aporrectodeae subsp. tuberculatae]|nr:hypothetical protein [Verminephrobacter aporrectodeae subsp. tuberculatae]MCW8202988.1 hypothetical protein [Verminephrobacter aporrectodeae subsp. tuberculatae]